MDDRELMELARMAMEAEEMESPRSRLRLAGTAPAHVRAFRLAGGLIAAAACLATAVVMLAPRPTPAPPPIVEGPSENGGTPEAPKLAHVEPPKNTDQCMLLAVFRGPDGVCDCMQWKKQEWEGGKKLAQVDRNELVGAVMKAPCTTSAERVVVVAMEGPADSLPQSPEAVQQIANRIAAAAPAGHEDVSAYASAAMSGLPKGATVVAKSIAMGR